MLNFGQDLLSNESIATSREWLVTNGIGGYASGTLSGVITRRYHGLLVAALQPPLGRTVLLSKLEETVSYLGQMLPLFTNRWSGAEAQLHPQGFYHQRQFQLEGTIPTWSFACGDALLQKRIWMQRLANTTYIQYRLERACRPMQLTIKALVDYRDFHRNTHAGNWQMVVEPVDKGIRIVAYVGAIPFYLLSDKGVVSPQAVWYRNFFWWQEHERGMDALSDNLYVAEFQVSLRAGETLTLVASTDPQPDLDGESAHAEKVAYERQLIDQSQVSQGPDWIRQLVLAADQFIVRRALPDQPDGCTILAGYHWFGDWGRDTMISLPGLTLVTGRFEEAAQILRTYARSVDRGMLPNRFPDSGQQPEYNTADATLWYFQAIAAYLAATGDGSLLQELFPVLQEIIEWHQRGTRYLIGVDPADGLLYAGEPGVQLTWMDAKVGDWVVTPRIGKPVEVNALWYNALRSMADFARQLGQPDEPYRQAAERVRESFARFWNEATGACFDVIDAPEGSDPALRPNQLLAVALPYSPLDAARQRAVLEICCCYLLASLGLRSLAPDDLDYRGSYRGSVEERDAAYHQGTVWSWLVGPLVAAHLRVYGDRQRARAFLQPFAHHLADYGIGSIGEIAEGNAPHRPRGAIAQAWSVAEVLRAWWLTEPTPEASDSTVEKIQ
jgi:predicted glycogen debranching enzyme